MTELDLTTFIRDVPDFPSEGILFKDVMPLMADPAAFRESIDRLAAWAGPRAPDVILGAEARGFIFGGALAYALGCGFVTARKPGKLPWKTVEASYDLEYGTDALQVHVDAIEHGARVIVLDDVLATGGTARAKIDLVNQLGGQRRRGALPDRALVLARPRPHRRHGRARVDRLLVVRREIRLRPTLSVSVMVLCGPCSLGGGIIAREKECRWRRTWTRRSRERRGERTPPHSSFATASPSEPQRTAFRPAMRLDEAVGPQFAQRLVTSLLAHSRR